MAKFLCVSEQVGIRLDVFLQSRYLDLSRTHIQKLISKSAVLVNGKREKTGYRLRLGDSVELHEPELVICDIAAENILLDIIYEDKDMIVINKKRGMVVHPAPGNCTGTLVNALLYHCHDLSGINGQLRPGIVHRLDKDTSGVMVAAKNDFAHISLAEQIRTKTAKREYFAIVHGNIKEEAGTIHGAIGRHPVDRKKMAIVAAGGKDALTKFRVCERFGKYTLIKCQLMTGRTHQIRVHMAFIGHPLLGDPKYCHLGNEFAIKGQALHSASLSLFHPRTGENMYFQARIPYDMEQILYLLRKQR